MEPTDHTSGNSPQKSGPPTFFIILAIIVVLMVAFMVLRPNPSGKAPSNPTSSPAPTSSQ